MDMKTEIGSSLSYLGITALVTGFLMFFVWIFQYCLWRSWEVDPKFDNRG
jgi:hypothetical protein